MDDFVRTVVGGVSVSRMIIGTNWFLGYSHASRAKDHFITAYQTRERIAGILEVFLQNGIDTIMGTPSGPDCVLVKAIKDAQNRIGKRMILIITPSFSTAPGRESEIQAGKMFDEAANLGATFCFPHQSVTDVLVDRMTRTIRYMNHYAAMIRQRGMIPGLSTHMPETIVYADNTGLDVESYTQIYNSSGFLMQVEADWIMRIIQEAKKPVMVIKPLAAGRITPPVGLAFVWNTIRDKDMVTIGTTTPDEAQEVIDISRDYLGRRSAKIQLQETRSKRSLA
jgi:hypothetical protein